MRALARTRLTLSSGREARVPSRDHVYEIGKDVTWLTFITGGVWIRNVIYRIDYEKIWVGLGYFEVSLRERSNMGFYRKKNPIAMEVFTTKQPGRVDGSAQVSPLDDFLTF